MTEEGTLTDNLRLCECGCGELIPTINKRGEPARFKHGHHRRGKIHPNSVRRGQDHWHWKGGRRIINGYVWIYSPTHPNKSKNGYVAEHRLVMEQYIGGYLNPDEIVHHINGDIRDNRNENLQLVTRAQHKEIHHPKIDMSTRICCDCKKHKDTRYWNKLDNELYRCQACAIWLRRHGTIKVV